MVEVPVERIVPPTDAVTLAEAAKRIGCSSEWIRTLVRTNRLRSVGVKEGGPGGPTMVVSLAEAIAVALKTTRGQGGHHHKYATKPSTKKVEPKRAHKAQGISQFVHEEIRDFAQHIMVDSLKAYSMVITSREDGTFDIDITPRTPEPLTLRV